MCSAQAKLYPLFALAIDEGPAPGAGWIDTEVKPAPVRVQARLRNGLNGPCCQPVYSPCHPNPRPNGERGLQRTPMDGIR